MRMTQETRTNIALSLVRCELSLGKSMEELFADYQSAKPYPYLVLDNFFPAELTNSLIDELPKLSKEKWVHERDEHLIKTNLRSAADLGEKAFEFVSIIHSAAFLYLFSEITGIRPLLPDPYLSGAGYHIVPEGGKFDVHADRNTDHNCGLERRIAMLTYLNKSWKPHYGGQLEIWNQQGTQCMDSIEPIFNRTVIFAVGDKNFHGVRPVVGPGVARRSFAAYFHTAGKKPISHNSIYAPEIYQRNGSAFRRLGKDILPPIVTRAFRNIKDRV